jgi:hypothetical protein
MHRHRLAAAAAVIALPFSLAACASGGTISASGQKSVQLNSATTSGAQSDTPSDTPTSQASASGSSAFCQALLKGVDDSNKLDSGDPSVTTETTQRDAEAALAVAPAELKTDMKLIVDSGSAAVSPTAPSTADNPQTDAATERIANWQAANCPK